MNEFTGWMLSSQISADSIFVALSKVLPLDLSCSSQLEQPRNTGVFPVIIVREIHVSYGLADMLI